MTTVIDHDRSPTRASKRKRPRLRGRGWPVAVIGIAAVVVFALGAFAWASSATEGSPRQVLVAAAAMEAGHVIEPGDLGEAMVETDGLDLIGSDRADALVGRTVAVPVVAGAPLSPSLLGPVVSPAPGRAVTSLALLEGTYPEHLEAGRSVVLVEGPGTEPSAEDATVWQMGAVVRSVAAFDGGALISLEFDAADRAGLSAARGTNPFLVAMTADLPDTQEGE